MDKKQMGLKIKALRTRKALSQQELARKLNIDRTTLSKIETGENHPTTKILVELKRIFSISIDWLLTANGPGAIEPNDKDVNELLTVIKEDKIVKHAVLGFFYEFKADNPKLFKKALKRQIKIEGGKK